MQSNQSKHPNAQSATGGGSRPQTAASLVGDRELDLKAYYHLCRIVGPGATGVIQKFLRESAQYDEDSYVFKHALTTAAQFRVAASMPLEVARLLADFRECTDAAIQKIRENQDLYLNGERERRGTTFTARCTKFFGRRNGVPQTGNQQNASSVDAWIARNAIWILVSFSVATCLFWIGIRRHEQARADQVVEQANISLAERQVDADEKTKQKQTQNDAELNQRKAELEQARSTYHEDAQHWAQADAQRRFDTLEPKSYALAVQLERATRRVKLRNGKYAREISFGTSMGYISSQVDPIWPATNLLVYLEEKPTQ